MERSPELEDVIVDWWHAFSRGDGSWFDGHVSRGALSVSPERTCLP